MKGNIRKGTKRFCYSCCGMGITEKSRIKWLVMLGFCECLFNVMVGGFVCNV